MRSSPNGTCILLANCPAWHQGFFRCQKKSSATMRAITQNAANLQDSNSASAKIQAGIVLSIFCLNTGVTGGLATGWKQQIPPSRNLRLKCQCAVCSDHLAMPGRRQPIHPEIGFVVFFPLAVCQIWWISTGVYLNIHISAAQHGPKGDYGYVMLVLLQHGGWKIKSEKSAVLTHFSNYC